MEIFDLSSFDFIGEPILISTVSATNILATKGWYDIFTEPDHGIYVFSHRFLENDELIKKTKITYIDLEEHKVKWHKKLDRIINPLNQILDDKDNLHFINTSIKVEKIEKKESIDSKLYVYSILNDNGDIIKRTLHEGNQLFVYPRLIKNVNGNLNLVCYFQERSSYKTKKSGKNDLKGTFFYELDYKTEKIITEKINYFDQDLIESIAVLVEKEKEGKSKAVENRRGYDYNVARYLIIPNNKKENDYLSEDGVLLITEQKKREDRISAETPGFAFLYYRKLIVSYLSNKGEVKWTQIIPRYQFNSTENNSYSGYNSFIYNDKLHILYNDLVNNKDVVSKSFTYKPSVKSKAYVLDYSINLEDGNKKIGTFFSQKTHLIRPSLTEFDKEKNKLFIISNSKKNRFGVINLEEIY